MRKQNPYEVDLDKNAANHVPLSPLSFIQRTAAVYPQRTAVIHGDLRRTWRETYERCVRLASALARRGIGMGDTVAVMSPNIPECLEAHFGVPMSGAVLNALNIRLDAESIAFILQHSEAKVLITDREFSPVIGKALERLANKPEVVDIDDPQAKGGDLLGELNYEQLLAEGDPEHSPGALPADEWQAISLNYTSGTTGNPKGVVYHHRGAYLNAVGNALTWAMPHFPVYLWTLPMFHCNGWCFPWTITAMAGTHVCLRQVTAKAMYDAIADHKVTHLCGAPIVMGTLVNAPGREQARDSERRAGDDRRRRSAGGHHREDAEPGLQGDPRLWADGGLWPGHGVRLAGGMERVADRRTGDVQGAAGSALRNAGRIDGWRSAFGGAGAAATARRWARSSCAAIRSCADT